jgi:hypothetical protein
LTLTFFGLASFCFVKGSSAGISAVVLLNAPNAELAEGAPNVAEDAVPDAGVDTSLDLGRAKALADDEVALDPDKEDGAPKAAIASLDLGMAKALAEEGASNADDAAGAPNEEEDDEVPNAGVSASLDLG